MTGPRQSGKTTLSRYLFGEKPYLSFENPSVQFEAEQNPESFLDQYKAGAVLDEVQRMPDLFRYLQGTLDANPQRGQFILTGSNNFLLQERVSQSLAGRAGYLSLLPLSYAELQQANLAKETVQQHMLTGGYPEIWNENLFVTTWMNSYVQTYVQRDVRLLRNISNLAAFTRFLYLCANYAGQIVNRDDLARKTGVDTKTIMAWLGLLENSYVAFLLHPWYNNLNKRIVKSPKLYFYDTGLLCFLLGIKTESGLQKHAAYGAIFENWMLAEIRKNQFNAGGPDNMYYFRDAVGNEVDLILDREDGPLAVEVKSAVRVETAMLRGLNYWHKLQPQSQCVLLHGGSGSDIINDQISVAAWMEVANL